MACHHLLLLHRLLVSIHRSLLDAFHIISFFFCLVTTTTLKTSPQTTVATSTAFTTTVICPLTEGMSPSQNLSFNEHHFDNEQLF
jgi:hypothetical protein